MMSEDTEKEKNSFWKIIDSRLGLSRLAYHVPEHGNTLPYMLGGIALGCFAILVATGIFMAQFYSPPPPTALTRASFIWSQKCPSAAFSAALPPWAASHWCARKRSIR